MTEAAVRPAGWELPLFVHVGGAMLLVGALVVVPALFAAAGRGGGDAAHLHRVGFRVLAFAALPGYVAMRGGAEWVASKQDWGDPAWIGIGYVTSDAGVLLLVIATVLAWRATRRGAAGAGRLGTAVVGVSALLLLAFTITIWAMTTKPE
jgi:hypothetical protein